MPTSARIPILKPKHKKHQFVMYGDSCSGVPGALHETTFQQVNAVIQRLNEPPQFICFPGDEIMGLTTDPDVLRRQWAHFFEHEMAWLDRRAIPLYHTTGNHTAYSPMSEGIFREVMAHLPPNGPPEQRGLSYFVRRDDLLMIFVHTLWSGLGGEGQVETEWLEETLGRHADAKRKLVFGHHPVWAVNGYYGDYQRHIERQNGRRFWEILARHEALAYVCSHILAFDVQLRQGVLQICTAGAGTAHRMPAETEYPHVMQAALDDDGLRYQVLDGEGKVREWLCWDWRLPSSDTWAAFEPQSAQGLPMDCLQNVREARLVVWDIAGQLASAHDRRPQTFLCANSEDGALPRLWLGVAGHDRRLVALLSPRPNRSPHSWHGPALPATGHFHIQFAMHSGMGPGGLLWRWDDDCPWSSLTGASPWGVERLKWSSDWTIGMNQGRQVFRGRDLRVNWHWGSYALDDYLG